MKGRKLAMPCHAPPSHATRFNEAGPVKGRKLQPCGGVLGQAVGASMRPAL